EEELKTLKEAAPPSLPLQNPGYKYKYQGQERQDEFGLNWDSFKWRNYSSDLGRFWVVDPLAEKYSYQSPYNFAENMVISHIELEGLEGLHHTKTDKAGNRSHVIEKNIIVLTQKTNSNYSDKKNSRITRNNFNRVKTVKSELNNSFSNAKNSKGESVEFKFNVSGMEVENTKTVGSKREQAKIALENGLEGAPKFDGGPNDIAPAAIITTNPTGQSFTNGIEIETEEDSHIGHEVGHTLMTRSDEENRPGTGGLMDDPPGGVRNFEVDKMIEDSVKAIE
ncbi:MAG: hypothetical protein COZ75_03525, partial [Flavobacteriaceae bacterium CG_4_8_14_3_um_filter_34_10]